MFFLHRAALLIGADRFLPSCRLCRFRFYSRITIIWILDHDIIQNECYIIQPAFYIDIKVISFQCITSRQTISSVLPDRNLLITKLCDIFERPAIRFFKYALRDITGRYLLPDPCVRYGFNILCIFCSHFGFCCLRGYVHCCHFFCRYLHDRCQ